MSRKPDLIVVGAGVAGLISALAALRHGYRPVILEAAPRAGGLWTSHETTLGDRDFLMDAGLRLPVLSGMAEWDDDIFFNSHVGFDWIRWRGWPVESGITQGSYAPQSSCVDARVLGPERLREGIARMVAALQVGPSTTLADHANDAAYVRAFYGDIFAQDLFEPALMGMTGQRLEEAAPGSSRTFVPKRLLLCDAAEVPALEARHPVLKGYLGHADHAALPKTGARAFVCPAPGHGIRGWIESLCAHLGDLGAEFRFGTRATGLATDADGVAVTTDTGEVIRGARLIWTVPPVLLLQLLPDLGVTPIRPELMSLGIQHLRLADFPRDRDAQYVLNFNADAGFFRAVFWDNILPQRDHLLSFELLLPPGPPDTAPPARDTATRAIADLVASGALPDGVDVLGEARQIFPYALPRITPDYKRMNDALLAALAQRHPAIACVGRAAGGSLFLDDIIQEAVQIVRDT